MSSQFSCSVFFFVPCSWKHCWNSFPCLLIEILLCNVWRRYTVLQIAIYCEIIFFGLFFCGLLVPYIYVCVCVCAGVFVHLFCIWAKRIFVFYFEMPGMNCLFISLWCWQVGALNFGDFYNVQYVNMYNVFMVQLQVC